ncbi:hypothetical protein OAD66_07985 [Bacteroidia bacterium]|nr:hypothetical protein [Bacteroidia bacterium]
MYIGACIIGIFIFLFRQNRTNKKTNGSAQKDNQVAPNITSRAIHENEQTIFRRFVISAFNEDYLKINND